VPPGTAHGPPPGLRAVPASTPQGGWTGLDPGLPGAGLEELAAPGLPCSASVGRGWFGLPIWEGPRDEIDQGQKRGEVATQGGARNFKVEPLYFETETTLDNLGVSKQRLAEWRSVRDMGELVVEAVIREALASGRARAIKTASSGRSFLTGKHPTP
jgi:hypothetical protein